MQHKTGVLSLAGAALAAGLFFGGTADAAPQVLALAATDGAVALACADGVCQAEFSAYCLQQERFGPAAGTPYRLTAADSLTITARDAAGRSVTLAPGDWLHIETARRHTAVRIRADADDLQRRGLTGLTVAVADNATLAPAANIADGEPLSADEIATVEQTLRPVGADLVDHDIVGMSAARVVNRLVNALPAVERDRTATARQWTGFMQRARDDGLSPGAAHYAQSAFDLCRFATDRGGVRDMRHCMQGQHDQLMDRLNGDYWKAVRTGS